MLNILRSQVKSESQTIKKPTAAIIKAGDNQNKKTGTSKSGQKQQQQKPACTYNCLPPQ